MSTSQNLASLWRRVRPKVRRALCLLFIFSFLLPYVDVKGCTTKTTGTYYGYDLIQGESAVLYLVAIGIFLLLLVLSFLVKEGSASFNAFAASWRAMAAATAGVIVLLFPDLDFLFDTVFMGPGQLIGVVTAALLFIRRRGRGRNRICRAQARKPRRPAAVRRPGEVSCGHDPPGPCAGAGLRDSAVGRGGPDGNLLRYPDHAVYPVAAHCHRGSEAGRGVDPPVGAGGCRRHGWRRLS